MSEAENGQKTVEVKIEPTHLIQVKTGKNTEGEAAVVLVLMTDEGVRAFAIPMPEALAAIGPIAVGAARELAKAEAAPEPPKPAIVRPKLFIPGG